MQCLAELIESLVVHVQHAVHFADDVQEMRVGTLGEVEAFQVGVFLEKLVLLDVF